MLVLTRGIGDRIVLGDNIVLTVVRVRGQRVHLGLEAPLDVSIRRAEVQEPGCMHGIGHSMPAGVQSTDENEWT